MDHAATARRYLGYTESASGDHLNTAQDATLNVLTGIGHALLDVADALREQTNASDIGGVRDDLRNIEYALRKGES